MVLRRLRDPSGAGDTALPPEKSLEKSEHTIRPLPAVAFITRIYVFIQTPQNHPWPEKWRKPR
jgi:hypothetical protein